MYILNQREKFNSIYFFCLIVNINEYHKEFIIDSNIIENFTRKFEFLTIEKIILYWNIVLIKFDNFIFLNNIYLAAILKYQ